MMYDWVNSTLLSPSGLYWDRLDLDGNVETSHWSYNQGTMIGAGALLYSFTRDSRYLTLAQHTANAALSQYGDGGYWEHLPAFNAIFFRNLLLLSTVDASYRPATMQAMQQYADDAWQHNRTPANLFCFPAGQARTRLLDQAAMVGIYACLDWDPAKHDLLV
jgi:predicted alpha-1,6-mannanase (GH76 family)